MVVDSAKTLHELFIVNNSEMMVNLSWDVREQVTLNMESAENGTLDMEEWPFIFEKAELQILKLMVNDPFRRFRATDMYKSLDVSKYAEEVVVA